MLDWGSLLKLDDTERKDLVDRLFEESKPSPVFYLLLILSCVIATIGLLQGSSAIVIGGMLVAPLLAPALSLGAAIITGNPHVVTRSINVLVRAILLVVAIGIVIGVFYGQPFALSELVVRKAPTLPDLFIAIAAGVAAAFAYSHPKMSTTLPGIAVAVSLLPPLAGTGVFLSMREITNAVGAFGLSVINLLGIVFASIVVFSMMNIYRARSEAVKAVEKEEKEAETGKGMQA